MFENRQDPKYAERLARCFERDFKSSSRSLPGLTLRSLLSLFHFLSACMLFKMGWENKPVNFFYEGSGAGLVNVGEVGRDAAVSEVCSFNAGSSSRCK